MYTGVLTECDKTDIRQLWQGITPKLNELRKIHRKKRFVKVYVDYDCFCPIFFNQYESAVLNDFGIM